MDDAPYFKLCVVELEKQKQDRFGAVGYFEHCGGNNALLYAIFQNLIGKTAAEMV
jgi:hypothetical protein